LDISSLHQCASFHLPYSVPDPCLSIGSMIDIDWNMLGTFIIKNLNSLDTMFN